MFQPCMVSNLEWSEGRGHELSCMNKCVCVCVRVCHYALVPYRQVVVVEIYPKYKEHCQAILALAENKKILGNKQNIYKYALNHK